MTTVVFADIQSVQNSLAAKAAAEPLLTNSRRSEPESGGGSVTADLCESDGYVRLAPMECAGGEAIE